VGYKPRRAGMNDVIVERRRHMGTPVSQGRCSTPCYGSGEAVTRAFMTESPSSHSAARKGGRGRCDGGHHHRQCTCNLRHRGDAGLWGGGSRGWWRTWGNAADGA
jgi:hypothetical protein